MIARNITAILMGGLAALCVTTSVLAADVGARVYIQPWNPADPNDTVQTFFDQPKAFSEPITNAWNDNRQSVHDLLVAQLAEHDIGGGFRLHIESLVLGDANQFGVKPTGNNAAQLQFVLANTQITASIRTPGPAPSSSDPEFTISFDLLNTLDLTFSKDVNGLIHSGAGLGVHVQNFQKTAVNDSAKALDAAAAVINALVKFFTSFDLEQIALQVLEGQNLVGPSFQKAVNDKIQALNAQLAPAAPAGQLVQLKMWADNNRVTLYLAPLPIPVVLNGTMSGGVTWDSSKLKPTAACSFEISATVQTGPRPLLDSSGVRYGDAPTKNLALAPRQVDLGASVPRQTEHPTDSNHCDYTLSGLASGSLNLLQAKAGGATIVNGPAGGNGGPSVGEIHPVVVIQPKGWAGDSVLPNATGRDYELVVSLGGSSGVGVLQQKELAPAHAGSDGPWSGSNAQPATQESAPGAVTNQTPGAASTLKQQSLPAVSGGTSTGNSSSKLAPGAANSLNPQPLPPKTATPGEKIGATSHAAPLAKGALNPAAPLK